MKLKHNKHEENTQKHKIFKLLKTSDKKIQIVVRRKRQVTFRNKDKVTSDLSQEVMQAEGNRATRRKGLSTKSFTSNIFQNANTFQK